MAACAISLPAFAEGYQVNSQSARQAGMAHTGVALKLGAESMLFNPAGMSFMDSKFDISLGVTGIVSKVKYQNGNNVTETENPLSTPLFGYIGYKPCKNLAFGVSITNPAGNSLVWPNSWAGSTIIQDISLKAFSVQPTVSYKFGNIVSIGAGLMIDFGSFNQNKALVPQGTFDQLGTLAGSLSGMIPAMGAMAQMIGSLPQSDLANIELSGKSDISYGFNVGVMVNVSPKVTIGASYRSTVQMNVNGGEAKIIYANDAAKNVINTFAGINLQDLVSKLPANMAGALDLTSIAAQQQQLKFMSALDGAKFNASLPIPSILMAGVAYKPIEDLTLTGDFQYTGWKAYDELNVEFDETTGNYTISSKKEYDNSYAIRIGGEYVISDLAAVRLGGYIDTTPVHTDNYNPETPGATTFGATAGATLSPVKFMAIDLTLAYLAGQKTYGSYTDGGVTFAGEYQKSAFIPAIGLRFKF
ncbi:MAG: outer membrane protein transport protein [Bacteroidales bacterium]|nr:outer membrane protein transport protein [Bacteroidales bacterium]